MLQRVENILKILLEKGDVTNYELKVEDEDGYQFSVECKASKLGHKTWFAFRFASDVMRFELTHIFGYLDEQAQVSLEDLITLLIENFTSFKQTSAYLSIKPINDNLFCSLQAIHQYLIKWSDQDIADAISLVLLDLDTGLISFLVERPSIICPLSAEH